ncbi:MAG: MinD/ParA family protein [Pseudomonadota bacterium]
MSATPVKTIAVTGGKGGVGKTNVSVNLAVALALQGKSVCILDADLGLANVDIMLGIYPKHNLSHVMQGIVSLTDILIRGPHGIYIIPGGSGLQFMADLSDIECAGIIQAFSELSLSLDVLIVDTAAGIARNIGHFCKAAQDVIIVTCDEPAALTDAYALIKLLHKAQDIQSFKVLSNMVQTGANGRELFEKLARTAYKFLDIRLEYIGHVPYDENLRKALQKQRCVVEAYPRSKSALGFKNLATRAAKWPLPMAAAGHLEFFVERLIRASRGIAEVTV